LWTEQDRAEVLALQLYRDSFCPCGCGLKAEDTLAPEESGPGFVVNQITCQARIVILEEQRAAAEKRGTDNAAARLWSVDKKRR
jgi:hypothetical protein